MRKSADVKYKTVSKEISQDAQSGNRPRCPRNVTIPFLLPMSSSRFPVDANRPSTFLYTSVA